MKSLHAKHHQLSSASAQIDLLEQPGQISFQKRLDTSTLGPLVSTGVEILQLNLGKMCNQTCAHCHVDAGPDRKEIMTRQIMADCLRAIDYNNIKIADLTGGAPELNPDFRWFVEQLSSRGVHVMVRCNLTIILANPKFHDLPEFFAQHGVEIISSLPHFAKLRTDAQRGSGVFEQSIKALKMLNSVGYGQSDSGLTLNLVYNPSGAFLPPDQASLERDFKDKLWQNFGIVFNELFAITNMPISRFLEYLVKSDNYESYMEELINSFNPAAVQGLMCKSTLSVSWDGQVYDCDFNQMLELNSEGLGHIVDLAKSSIPQRSIRVGQHCFGCTAGAGSSCGGEIA